MNLLQGVTNLEGALPPPDTRRVVTREMMRRHLLDHGIVVRAGATRDEMLPIFGAEGLSLDDVGTTAQRPAEYRPAPITPKPEKMNVAGYGAQQLKAICKQLDPEFRPPTKANRWVYMAFLYGRGLVDANVFADAE